MRIYPKRFSSIVAGIANSAICAVLLYGPDKGMIECFIHDIKQILSLNLRKIDVGNITNINLAQITNSISLFAQKEIIVLKNFGPSLTKENVIGMLKLFTIVADKSRNRSRRFGLRFYFIAEICNMELVW